MMDRFYVTWSVVAAALLVCGCAHVPGVPAESAEADRPDRQLDFHPLYQHNCAGCHGDNGRGGAAIALNNPAYLAVAGAENLGNAAAKGVPGTLMPPFARSFGGMLTDKQVEALVEGMLHEWSRPADFGSSALPAYAAAAGNPVEGQKDYAAACARCHGVDGTGTRSPVQSAHSIVDPSFLSLVNDQNLRSYVIAGHIDNDAPDWRSYIPGHALSSEQINDIVAWIASHRVPVTAQPIGPPGGAGPGVEKKEQKQ